MGKPRKTCAGSRRGVPVSHDKSSLAATFLGLPNEILIVIIKYLMALDLALLCRTCRAIQAVVEPMLYEHVIIKTPVYFSRLPQAEELMASATSKLIHTSYLSICHRQNRATEENFSNLEGLKRENLDKVEKEVGSSPASNLLNTFTRMLLRAIPANRLQYFRWESVCVLDSVTLATIARFHPNIHQLDLEGYSDRVQLSSYLLEAVEALKIRNRAKTSATNQLLGAFLVHSRESLRTFRLGFEDEVDIIYQAEEVYETTDEDAEDFLTEMSLSADSAKASVRDVFFPSVEELELCGIDLFKLQAQMDQRWRLFDFGNLNTLVLEQCSGLAHTLDHLKATAGQGKCRLDLNLKSLTIREDSYDEGMYSIIEQFLCSFQGLTCLYVLLDGFYPHSIAPVLKEHGKTLRTLIWDERSGRRFSEAEGVHVFLEPLGHVSNVAKYCPEMRALGIAIDWDAITWSDELHTSLSDALSKLPKLETLNIRNMPMTKDDRPWLTHEVLYQAFANNFARIACFQKPLRTFALGALIYEDAKLGRSYLDPEKGRDFLKLRIYYVGYNVSTLGRSMVECTQVASHTAEEAEGICPNLDIFKVYWMG